MKKTIIFFMLAIFVLPSIFALNLKVEKTSSNEVMIADLNKPAVFDLKITNLGADDHIEFYNLVGFTMFPVGTVPITAGETKDIKLEVSPIGEFEYMGRYNFKYYIRSQDGSEIEQQIAFKRIKMEDAFSIGVGDFDPESNSVQIYLENLENFDFGQVTAKFSSSFFNLEKTIELGPNKKETINLELNKEDFKQLLAGFYTMDVEINAKEKKINLETTLKFAEKNIVTKTERDYGFLITTKIVKRTNEGNVITSTETIMKKNIISRLFTTFSPEPDNVERRGIIVYYTWDREINPGETLEIAVKTNWLFPFLIVLLIVAVVLIAKQYSKTNLELKKQVTFVKVKGGEFALKVSVFAKAQKFIENVTIIDRYPPLAKLYNKFGIEKPSKVDDKLKKLEWNFANLQPGETRILSYIIYSKVGVIGRFALPSAAGIFERDGEVHETESNRAFFVAEQRTKDIPDEEAE